MENVELLKKIEMFKGLTSFEIIKVGKLIKSKNYKAGSKVVTAGDEGESLFIVKEGEVRVSGLDQDGKEETLATLGLGDHFGEVSLLDRQPRSADVYADKDAKLLEISKKDLDNLLSHDKSIALKVYKAFAIALCKRLRSSNENLIYLKGLEK